MAFTALVPEMGKSLAEPLLAVPWKLMSFFPVMEKGLVKVLVLNADPASPPTTSRKALVLAPVKTPRPVSLAGMVIFSVWPRASIMASP